ncbi:DUF4911 domain-containing protein [Sporomusa sp.]|uniref:DUF4911 domain-containing protein n=1 Tax=Sporomusa sp. TaxID=2078658 RepID=UPI002BA094F6|nr:DUF4911 domain-containing protein [Sporomusa sp.]HWR44914.1 DUF4911 domain-containing protein [Sporomusa sp.]
MNTLTSSPIYIQVEPRNVNFINRIMEGYEYLGVVSTLDRTAGILVIRATPDTAREVHNILANLPISVQYIER